MAIASKFHKSSSAAIAIGARLTLIATVALTANLAWAVSTVSINRTAIDGAIQIFDLEFSREVQGLEPNDLVVNGIIDSISGGGNSYRLRLRHNQPGETVFVSIRQDAVTDSSGGGNFGATRVYPPTNLLNINPNNGVITGVTPRTGDGLPLENELQAAVFPISYTYPISGRPYPLRVSFDRAVGGFNADNIKVNGEVDRFTGAGAEYYIEVTPEPDATDLRVGLQFFESGSSVILDAITIPIIARNEQLQELDDILVSALPPTPAGAIDELGRSQGNPVELPLPPVTPEDPDTVSIDGDNGETLLLTRDGIDTMIATDGIAIGDDFITADVLALARSLQEREQRIIERRDAVERAEAERQRQIESQFLYNFRLLVGAGISDGGDPLVASSGDLAVDINANTGSQYFLGGQYYIPGVDNFSLRGAYERMESSTSGNFAATLVRTDLAGGFMYDYQPWKLQGGIDFIYSSPSLSYSEGITDSSDFLYTSSMASTFGFRFHVGYMVIPQLKVEFRLIPALSYDAVATRGGTSGDQQTANVSADGVAFIFSGIINLDSNKR